MLKQIFVLFFLVTIAFTKAEYFAIVSPGGPEFVVELIRPEDIMHARGLAEGYINDKPHIMGKVIPRRALYNRNYDYHIDPISVNFFNGRIDGPCEATFWEVRERLSEICDVFLPACLLCPPETRIIRELNMVEAFNIHERFRAGGRYYSKESNCS